MKWGVRKDDNEKTRSKKKQFKKAAVIVGATLAAAGTAYLGYKIYKLNPGVRHITTFSGEQITTQPFQSRFDKILSGILDPSYSPLSQKTVVITGADKRKAGEMFYTVKKKSMHIDWIGVRESHRNKGYARSVLEDMIKQAKTSGLSEITLDATGGADKLYSKLGFVQTGVATLATSYGIPMRLDLTKLGHSDMANVGRSVADLTMTNEELKHFGILGMKWGVRRTPAQLGNLSKKDNKWVKKNSDKITENARKKSAKELNKYAEELMKDKTAINKTGKLSAASVNSYNKKMANLMNTQVSGITSPSGKVVQFVAKRGEIGVFMALADQGYNMNRLKNGVYDSGKIAYKKTVVDKIEK